MIFSINENGEIVKNSVVDIKKHLVDEYYKIVPRYWALDSYGAINSRKPIKVTEHNSLMCYDEDEKSVVLKPISEYLTDPARYHAIISGPETEVNDSVKIHDVRKKIDVEIELTHILGFMLIVYMKQLRGEKNIVGSYIHEFLDMYEEEWIDWFDIDYKFYRKTYNSSLSELVLVNIKEDSPFKVLADSVIIKLGDRIVLANEIYYSSNIDFVLGILEALMNTEEIMVHEIGEMVIPHSIHPSVYTNCLNFLFANYRIMKASYMGYPRSYNYSVRFTLSPDKITRLRLSDKKVKVHNYTRFINSDGNIVIDNWYRKNIHCSNTEDAVNDTVASLMENKIQDKIKFIRLDEMVFTPIRTNEPEALYDLVMGNGTATNYAIPGIPLTKNSDGDVLAAMSIMTGDALKSSDKLMMSHSDRLRDGTDPDKIRNWIQKDAVVGLYQATK